MGACCTGLLRFPLVNSSSWFPNHVKGAVTRFLIVPRKDELWRTSFAGRRSLLVGDIDADEQSSATVNKSHKKSQSHMFPRLLHTVHRTRRTYSTQREAWLYIDSVFPIQIARWEYVFIIYLFILLIHPTSLRHYIGILRQEDLLIALQSRFDRLSSVHNFRPIEFQPQRKDGGVFVRFSYTSEDEQPSRIEDSLRKELAKHGALPSWLGFGRGTIWLVKGTPWKEVIAYLSIVLTQWHDNL